MGIWRPQFLLEQVKKLGTVTLKISLEGLICKKHVVTDGTEWKEVHLQMKKIISWKVLMPRRDLLFKSDMWSDLALGGFL